MAKVTTINHVTLIVDNLEKAAAFYEHELGLEVIPAFLFDYPTAFFKINDTQQLHLSEWEDQVSFRGHICMVVDDFNTIFYRMKALGVIDDKPWGKVRQLPEGAMQMFVRDPAGNLVEISSPPGYKDHLDPAIFQDEWYKEGLYISGRNDYRGYKTDQAKLYHAQ